MADYRFGSTLSAGGAGPDYRFGSVLFASLSTRTVGNISIDSALPGTVYTLPLGGTWDAGSKSALLNGIALTITDEGTDFIEFTVPEPYGDGSDFDTLALNTVYAITVDDSAVNPTSGSFRIDAPAPPTYHYIPSITGTSWVQSSVLYQSDGVANGDSLIAEVLAGGPFKEFNPDGTYILLNPARFRLKAYNADGWSASWAEFVVDDDALPVVQEITVDLALLTVRWDQPVYLNTEAAAPTLSISATLGAAVATYAAGAGTDEWLFTLSRIITLGEVATASRSYVADSIETVSGEDLPAFSSIPITNESGDSSCFFFGPNLSDRTARVGEIFTVNPGARFRNAVSFANISGDALPDGLTLDSETGLISGSAEVAEQVSTVEIEATGAGAETATSNVFTLTTALAQTDDGVIKPPIRPVIRGGWKSIVRYE
jgi:hypothetical protein